jgi:anti-sigma regulatory factor (Ser/Thr protein kinase)
MVTVTVDRCWMRITDPALAAAVRRAAITIGEDLRLPSPALADLAIVSMEIATNLARHADDGMILLRERRTGDHAGVEIVAIDSGPGMIDVVVSARDGQSTAGTLGIGLGAIGRLSSEMDIYSWPGAGTVLASTVWDTTFRTTPLIEGVSRPIDGEEVCGDAYSARTVSGRQQILLCDGLGHGPLAAVAAQAVVTAFHAAPATGPRGVLDHIHRRTPHTRGAVAGIAELDPQHGVVRFAGIGNVAATVVTDDSRRAMVSLPGIVGHQLRDIREFDYPMPADALVVLHSDGLTDRWTLANYPGISTHTPVVIAATLLRDAGRRRDDAAVLVARAQ